MWPLAASGFRKPLHALVVVPKNLADADVEVTPTSVGECRNRSGQFAGRNINAFELEEMVLLEGEEAVPFAADLDHANGMLPRNSL